MLRKLFPPMQIVVERLFYTTVGQHAVCILFGFALATLFQKVCKDGKCIQLESPPLEEIRKHVYKLEGVCYKYEPVIVSCDAR